MSLSNIVQSFGNVSGLRTKLYVKIVLNVAQMLKRRGIDVIMVPKFQPGRGVRKPNHVVEPSKELIVLDVQIRSDSAVCNLDACYRGKIAKYS